MLRATPYSAGGWPVSLPSSGGLVAASPRQRAMIRTMRRPAGLGATAQQNIMSSVQIAGATVSTAAGLGAGWATAIIPVIGPVIAGVTIGLSMLFARKGPKQKVATTQIVDAVEPKLKENLAGYLAGPRTVSSQAQAIANFDAAWAYVQEKCEIPEMGDPGKRCVSDRQRGGKWDWFSYYRDPISNDTEVKPDPTVTDSISSALFGAGSSGGAAAGSLDLSGLLLPAGLLLIALVV